MREHEKINYAEFPCRDFAATKAFFGAAFGWTFVEYGAEYVAFFGGGLDGGFYYHADLACASAAGGALIVLYSEDLESTARKVELHGGKIVRGVFSFPGGRRFHFVEPSGNELAVWSDK